LPSHRHGRTLRIIWPFLAIALLQVAFTAISADTLAALRAGVEGESNWAKAAKEAVAHLQRYATSHDVEAFKAFKHAITVPLGFQSGRRELDQPSPNYDVVSRAWIRAGMHPANIPAGIRLYERFRNVPLIREVIVLWSDADQLIGLLDQYAEEIRQRIEFGAMPGDTSRYVNLIQEISDQITPKNRAFSAKLGEASLKTSMILVSVNVAMAATLLPLGILLSRRMVRRSYAFEDALRLSEERFQLAVSGSNDGLWDWDLAARDLYFSPRCRELFGIASDVNAVGRAFLRRIRGDDRERMVSAVRTHFDFRAPFDVEFRARVAQEERWFRMRGESVRGTDGKPVRMAGSISDITERKLAQAQLFAEKERAQVTLQSIGDAVITTDVAGRVQYLNPVAQALTGMRLDDAFGQVLPDVFPLLLESSRKPAPDAVRAVVAGAAPQDPHEELVLVRADGREIAVDRSAAPIRDREGQVVGAVLVFHDMTRERHYAARLSYQATHDELTGLINRREFERRLTHALLGANELGRHHAVMYLDLDQFKVVNDTCGHAAGDELMRRVTTTLQRRLREGDTLARLGGDEFGVLLENCGPGPAERIAEQLRNDVNEQPFAWHGRSFRMSVSIGVVHVADESFSLSDVLSAADTACYMAKEKGRNRMQVYSKGDSELSLRQGEMEWVGRIHRARDENRFRLYAQEIVPAHMPRATASHVELLVRMVDEHGTVVPPGAFLPAAERYNVMSLVDRWVIAEAFRIIEQLNRRPEGNPLRLCSINLSGVSIGDERFLDFIRELFKQHGVPPHSICFEITETAAVANLSRAAQFIEQLRNLGCRFSLDDFGAGMSSFSYLKHLPVDYLKIDGSFVKDMLVDPIDRAMVEAINNIGHVMDKRTIAEFVEDKEMLRALREIGVDYAQGFGLAGPRPFDASWGLPHLRANAPLADVQQWGVASGRSDDRGRKFIKT
jgi:diguanylate cyclase (GGDEF)-like protein/PAS domain S-box-containing protein